MHRFGIRLSRLALTTFLIPPLTCLPSLPTAAQDTVASERNEANCRRSRCQESCRRKAAAAKALNEKAADDKAAAVLAKMATRKLDPIAALQQKSVETRKPSFGYWGPILTNIPHGKSHSNRLIPLYAFGDSLDRVRGANSVYRDADKLEKLYGFMPTNTVNPAAEYFDQTDVYRLQKSAAEAGKKANCADGL